MNVRRALIIAVALLATAARADALMFEELTQDGHAILWLRDCGAKPEGSPCLSETTKFAAAGTYAAPTNTRRNYPGDAAVLQRYLERRRSSGGYYEIWLWSGGGSLDEGVEVGNVLHRYQATVRVPTGMYCVSACTVAFMGALFRYVDKGATYEVHAYSQFSHPFEDEDGVQLRNRLLFDPEGELARQAEDQQHGASGARYWAVRLFTFFQRTLLPPGQEARNGARLTRWQTGEVPPLAYAKSQALREDAARIRSEGLPAAQDILMRIERDSMDEALRGLRAILPELGPRAEPALRMLEAMFSSRITSTASLSQETLLQMGYITKDFGR